MLDPVIHFSLRSALSLLFLAAAAHKLRDFPGFRAAMRNYNLVPPGLTSIAAAVLIATEVSVAVALPLLEGGAPAVVAALLLAMYAAAIGINLVRGRRDIDCGCAGPARSQPLSRGLVVRNTVLCVLALATALEPSSRTLIWVDGATIAATIVFLCMTYASLDGLIAHRSRLVGGGVVTAQALKPSSPQAAAVGLRGVVQ